MYGNLRGALGFRVFCIRGMSRYQAFRDAVKKKKRKKHMLAWRKGYPCFFFFFLLEKNRASLVLASSSRHFPKPSEPLPATTT